MMIMTMTMFVFFIEGRWLFFLEGPMTMIMMMAMVFFLEGRTRLRRGPRTPRATTRVPWLGLEELEDPRTSEGPWWPRRAVENENQ